MLFEVPNTTPEKEVQKYLFEKNISDKYKFLSSIRLSYKSGKKDSLCCNFILEVSADISSMIMQQERLFINWTFCPFRDFTFKTRCYKCQTIRKDTESICRHYGCEGHAIKDCSKLQEPPNCASCQLYSKPIQYRAGDTLCPARKSAEVSLNFIDYDGV